MLIEALKEKKTYNDCSSFWGDLVKRGWAAMHSTAEKVHQMYVPFITGNMLIFKGNFFLPKAKFEFNITIEVITSKLTQETEAQLW